MEPSRSDGGGGHQQNVHLHMHHVCACQSLYPAGTYYPPLSYRTPLIPYAAPQTRPYLQHYQYTQFNVGSQYNMPTLASAAGYAAAAPAQQTAADGTVVAIPRRERGDSQESSAQENDRGAPDPPADFDFASGPVIPPVHELFFMAGTDDFVMNTDGFIKFLERSCLTAEQIAYRNRNRPCFRNIQNLCIRTRSEILKPRTTISNIHSQGIPWATKDFIYAFVRLTNCWHILKGYWENREGSALGKIEKELTPGFKACYVRWEKETVELATELTRIFYNLDVNQTNNQVNVHTANNLVPPQVQTASSTTSDIKVALLNKAQPNDLKRVVVAGEPSASATTAKNIRGIIHLPDHVDRANQTGDAAAAAELTEKSDAESEDNENAVVYMKPGSYRVPKKYKKELNVAANKATNSPRVIEFLDTAQNITKGLEAANDKYWIKVKDTLAKKMDPSKPDIDEMIDPELSADVYFNVHEWLSNSNFSDYGDRSSSTASPPKQPPLFAEMVDDCPSTALPVDICDAAAAALPSAAAAVTAANAIGSNAARQSSVTLLQRKLQKNNNNAKNGLVESRTYRRKPDTLNIMVYEMKSGGLTKKAKGNIEKILYELKGTELAGLLSDCVMDGPNLEMIMKNFGRDSYRFVNEIVRDLRHLINSAGQHFKKCEGTSEKIRSFSNKLETCMMEHFPNYDFGFIQGTRGEKVGKLKLKNSLFDGDDHVKN